MDKPLLNDAHIYPTDTVLTSILSNCIEVYQTFTGNLPEYGVKLEWRFYNDGNAWLSKGISKRKTVFWISIWQGFFKVSFHFTEKTRLGVMDLPIANEMKTRMKNEQVKGKLVSLIIDVSESTQLKDVFTLISYKQSCK